MTAPSVDEGVELLKLSFISGDNAKWFRCFGEKKVWHFL